MTTTRAWMLVAFATLILLTALGLITYKFNSMPDEKII